MYRKNNLQSTCGKSYWPSWRSLVVCYSLSGVQTKKRETKSSNDSMNGKGRKPSMALSHLLARIVQVAVGKVQVFIRTRKVNARILVGLFLAVCLAPIADMFYSLEWLQQFRLFNRQTRIEGWYYENLCYFFLSVGPYLFQMFVTVGLYYLFVTHKTKKSYLLTLPIAYTIAKFLWLCTVTSHKEFHSIPSILYMSYGLALSSFLWFITDYLAWRKYHRADAHESRMNGLCQIANMSDPIQAGFVNTWKEMQLKNY